MARVSTCHSISFDQASEQRFSWCADRSRAWSDLFSQKVGHLPTNDGAREVPSSKKMGCRMKSCMNTLMGCRVKKSPAPGPWGQVVGIVSMDFF